MTLIENDSPKVQYTGPFIKGQLLPLTFPYIATEDVKMIIDDTPAIFNVDYEIITEPNDEHPVAYPNSAYIKSDLPNAKQITLYRVTPLDQQAPFPQQSKFRSERVEQALDKLTMQQQEQEEQLSRCIIAPITLETFNGQLPAPAADQALKWNTDGTELENYDIIGEQEAFETDINTRFEEQSTSIENRIGQFEEETNTQFSEFRNEINENLEAVLNAAAQLEKLDTAVQNTENAAERANQSALSAQNSAQSAQEAIAIIDTKSSETIENINDIKTEAITDVEFVADMGKQEIQDLVDEMKDNADIIINRVGLNMFDPVVKDHILTYEESKGLALQGTYVYKNAIAGESYGYPDFYNKCLDEYRDSENQKQWLKSNITQVGSLVDNEGVISGFSNTNYAKFPEGYFDSSNPWEVVIKFKSSKTGRQEILGQQASVSGCTTLLFRIDADSTFYANASLNATDWYGVQLRSQSTFVPNMDYVARIKYTGTHYELYINDILEATKETSTKIALTTPILIGQHKDNYPFGGSIDLNESYINVDGQHWWSGVDTAIKNPNGHLFYDISDKDKIDNIFATTGMAWFYGIDEENERIFLPRNVWFEQMSMDDVGKAIEAGLPNITGKTSHVYLYNTASPGSGAFSFATGGGGVVTTSPSANTGSGVGTFDASRSSSIYGNSTTVQPNAVKKLLYICVGNTVSDTSWVDVVTQVQEGTKDIQEARDEAIEAMKSVTGGTVPLGFIGSAILGIDETLNLQRYLNGQIILQDQFKGFTKFLKRRIELYPSLACTEDEWQTTVTMSAFSQCGKFVIDDNAGTIRLPKVVNIQGLADLSKLGEIVEAGLPTHTHTRGTMNITGAISYHSWHGVSSGAFYEDSSVDGNRKAGTSNDGKAPASGATFNASRSWTGSTSTGNYSKALATTDTVQQEQIQYPYFIQVATGSETEDNIINEIELNNPYSFGDSKYSPKPLNNLSWLKSEGQYNSKAVYPAYYDWALTNFNNGVEGFALSTGEYTDYDVVINTAEETFRLPLLDGSEDLPSDNAQFVNVTATEFTMPYNGYLYLLATSQSDNRCDLSVDGVQKWHFTVSNAYFHNSGSTTFIRKGQSIKLNGTYYYKRYEKAQGNGSLYFYVGETVQNANLINAGRIEEKVASCITRNDCKAYIVESYVNGASWYRVWSDGFKEQGGVASFPAYTNNYGVSVTFLKPFSDANYTSLVQMRDGGSYWANVATNVNQNKAYLSITQWTDAANVNVAANKVNWYACGY